MTGLAWEDEGAHGGLMHRRSNTSCLTDQEVEEFIFNRLSGVTREVIEEHLLVCGKCLSRVEEEEEYIQSAKVAAREMESEDFERAFSGEGNEGGWRGWWKRVMPWFGPGRQRIWALALASVAIAGSGILFHYNAGREGPQDVELTLVRGASLASEAKAEAPLRLVMGVEDLGGGSYRLEMANSLGGVVATGVGQASGGRLEWKLGKGFRAGHYWVRVKASQGELLREFGLNLR